MPSGSASFAMETAASSARTTSSRWRLLGHDLDSFLGKEVTVSRQNARNWDTFLQHITDDVTHVTDDVTRITDDVKSTEAVRDLCTPTGGTRVT